MRLKTTINQWPTMSMSSSMLPANKTPNNIVPDSVYTLSTPRDFDV